MKILTWAIVSISVVGFLIFIIYSNTEIEKDCKNIGGFLIRANIGLVCVDSSIRLRGSK